MRWSTSIVNMVYGGLDIGTTGVKITLFDGNQEAGRFYRPYPSSRLGNTDEIDAEAILLSTKEVIREAFQARKDLAHLGVTSFGETFVLLDAQDHVLAPSLLYSDPRGKEEAEQIKATIGSKRMGQITGLRVHEMFSLPKILYIKAHCPEIWNRVDKIFLIQDYVVYSLTGVRQIDESLASRTMLFDVKKRTWSHPLFEAFGLSESCFSRPVPTGTRAGKIQVEGLPNSIEIYNVSHDQVSVAIGSGLRNASLAVDGAGTCECLIPYFETIPADEDIYADGFGVVPFVFPHGYVSYPLIFSGGALVQWFMDHFARGIENPYTWFESQIDPNLPSGLLLAPHFLGSGTPKMDSHAKGIVYGFDFSTGPVELYQACLEGVAFEMRRNLEILSQMGIAPKRLIATGGGAKNDAWLQIKANILGLPIQKALNPDAGAVGSAVVVGKSMGLFPSLEEGMDALVHFGETFVPNPEAQARYESLYFNYKSMVEKKEEADR